MKQLLSDLKSLPLGMWGGSAIMIAAAVTACAISDSNIFGLIAVSCLVWGGMIVAIYSGMKTSPTLRKVAALLMLIIGSVSVGRIDQHVLIFQRWNWSKMEIQSAALTLMACFLIVMLASMRMLYSAFDANEKTGDEKTPQKN